MKTQPTEWAMDWYRRNYPDGPEHDPRCMAVLCTWAAIYNLPIERDEPRPMIPLLPGHWEEARWDEFRRTGEAPTVRRADGGIRKCGTGLSVITRSSLSTFDMDELTSVVLAAHQHCCRVSFGPAFHDDENFNTVYDGLEISIHPRDPDGTDLFYRHPNLDDLIARATQLTEVNPILKPGQK